MGGAGDGGADMAVAVAGEVFVFHAGTANGVVDGNLAGLTAFVPVGEVNEDFGVR